MEKLAENKKLLRQSRANWKVKSGASIAWETLFIGAKIRIL
jgi:hypothetical protein